ncbi:LiaI-LiaF-like domain-containing protein [Pseudoduganella danionis]|uniref:LiaF transmembrane domain-containing protein n=1 Tax=Pseudoduganella danionis TaxID=1890295 RepID=UPI0035AFC5A2
MRTPRPRNPASQMVVGLFVIVIGLIFLLDNIGLLDLDFTLHLWPTALIFFGILKMLQTRTAGGAIVGGGLILFGGVIFLHDIGIIQLSWRALWPLMLILAGLSVVFKSGTGKSLFEDGRISLDKGSDDALLNITAILGGFQRRVTTPDFRGGEVTAVFGGCELDLRQSSINSVAVLNVFAMFGGITIKVPADWTVELEGTPIMGGFEEKTIVPPTQEKRLIVRGYAIMGGVEVRN